MSLYQWRALLLLLIVSEQKPNTAAEYVAAHLSKIHGLDWHPDNEFILATSSQDNSVRVRKSDTRLIPAVLTVRLLNLSVSVKEKIQTEQTDSANSNWISKTQSEDAAGQLPVLHTCLTCVFCVVLGLPTAQEVSEHPVLSGAGVEGQVHGEF